MARQAGSLGHDLVAQAVFVLLAFATDIGATSHLYLKAGRQRETRVAHTLLLLIAPQTALPIAVGVFIDRQPANLKVSASLSLSVTYCVRHDA